jgi:uncharacterized protein YebE (UPF0316 family)
MQPAVIPPDFLHEWILIPLLIFVARIGDVSMDTVRIMLLSKNKKFLAPLIGFIQVLVWLLAFRQIILNLSNPACYIGFASGFATGTYLGMVIEEKLALGFQVLRIITRKEATELISFLRQQGYGVTNVDGEGISGKVSILYTIVKRSEIPKLIEIVKHFNPKAFYTIEDVKTVSENGMHSNKNIGFN